MTKPDIAKFLAVTRLHLFGLGAGQPALATLPNQACRAR